MKRQLNQHGTIIAIGGFVWMMIGGLIPNPIVAFSGIAVCAFGAYARNRKDWNPPPPRMGVCAICKRPRAVADMAVSFDRDDNPYLVCGECWEWDQRQWKTYAIGVDGDLASVN